MQEHILSISLESDGFDKELLKTSMTLRELVENYKRKKLNFDKQHEKLNPEEDFEKETFIFDHLASNIIYFCNGTDFVNSSYDSNNAII